MNINHALSQQILDGINVACKLGKEPAFAYDRISTLNQAEGLSLSYQETHAEQYANRTNLHIIHFFTIVESAKAEGRRIFNEMIKTARTFGIKDLIFKNTDRMSRNYSDLVLIEKLIDNEDFNIHFYQNNKMLNKNANHNDRFMLGIEIAVAKQLSDKISHDVKQTYLYKAKQGIAPGRFPIGYKYDKERKTHYIDKDYEKLIRFIFDTFDNENVSLQVLTDKLNEMGYKTPTGRIWHTSYLHKILINPIYSGQFLYQGEIWEGNHEAYFTINRFNERLKKMGKKYNGKRKRKIEFLLSSFIQCGKCGNIFSGEMKKEKYIYYTHRNCTDQHHVSFRESDLLKQIDKEIEAIVFSSDFAEKTKEMFREPILIKEKHQKPNKSAISRKISELELKRSKLFDLFLDEDIDREILKSKMEEIRKEIKQLQNEKEAMDIDRDRFALKTAEVIDYVRSIPNIYKNSLYPEKIKLIRSMSSGILINDKDSIEINWEKPYCFILNRAVMQYADTPIEVRRYPLMHAREEEFRITINKMAIEFESWFRNAA